jgi:hypothetical protein
MFFPILLSFSLSDCPFVYISPIRFDSFLYYFWDCVIIRQSIFFDLTAGPSGLGGAISIVAPISDARITAVTFSECRAAGAGGACYLATTTTAIDSVCANNCSSGGHAHFVDLLADDVKTAHSITSSTVFNAGWFKSLRTTDRTLGIDGGSEVEISSLNFTNCQVSGEGAVSSCEPGSRPIVYNSLTIVGNGGQSLLHVDSRSSKPHCT